jgi:PAS domain-containing protein
MKADGLPLAGISQLDAAVQRLLTIRSEHGQRPPHPLLKQTLAEIDRAIEALQVMFEELSQGHDEVRQLSAAVKTERSRRRELMESLSVGCVFTDAQGIIQEANTSALLLLGGSLAGIGRDSLRDYAADAEACDAMLARAASEGSSAATFLLRDRRVAVNAAGAQVRNVHPPMWRWFLRRAPAADPE